jgi:hypothetical protein
MGRFIDTIIIINRTFCKSFPLPKAGFSLRGFTFDPEDPNILQFEGILHRPGT